MASHDARRARTRGIHCSASLGSISVRCWPSLRPYHLPRPLPPPCGNQRRSMWCSRSRLAGPAQPCPSLVHGLASLCRLPVGRSRAMAEGARGHVARPAGPRNRRPARGLARDIARTLEGSSALHDMSSSRSQRHSSPLDDGDEEQKRRTSVGPEWPAHQKLGVLLGCAWGARWWCAAGRRACSHACDWRPSEVESR